MRHCASQALTLFPEHVCCCSFGDNIKRVARQVQGALPLVGLLSRLTSPSGGIGKDMLVSTVNMPKAYSGFESDAIKQHAPSMLLFLCSLIQSSVEQPLTWHLETF